MALVVHASRQIRAAGGFQLGSAHALTVGTGYDWSVVKLTIHWWQGCSGRDWVCCAARPLCPPTAT
jgi:hypothetical protein